MATREEFLAATEPLTDPRAIESLANPTEMALSAEELARKRQAALDKWRWHAVHRAVQLLPNGTICDAFGNSWPLDADGRLIVVGRLYDTECGRLLLVGGGPGEGHDGVKFVEPELVNGSHKFVLHYPLSGRWPVRQA